MDAKLHQAAVLAMAGPAEAAEFFSLMIGWAALILIGVATAIGFWKLSWIWAGIAVVLAALTTILFLPWQAFAPLTVADLQDSDVQSWVQSWRYFAVAWMIVGMAAVVTCLGSVRVRPMRSGTLRGVERRH
jgi:hypothetical protein